MNTFWFMYLLPAWFSITSPLIVVTKMSHLIGTDDHDLAIDMFFNEPNQSVRDTFFQSRQVLKYVVNNSAYDG